MSDNCVIGPDGSLLDTDLIEWRHSETDDIPMISSLPYWSSSPLMKAPYTQVPKESPLVIDSSPAPPAPTHTTPAPPLTIKHIRELQDASKASSSGRSNPKSRSKNKWKSQNKSSKASKGNDGSDDEPHPKRCRVVESEDSEGDAEGGIDCESELQSTVPPSESQDTQTANVETLFDKIPRPGKAILYSCRICKHAGKKKKDYELTGGVTAARQHIGRKSNIETHFVLYKQQCEASGILLHDQAIPKPRKPSNQPSLDSFTVVQPKITPWTKDGLLDHIIELVVSCDQAFQIVDRGPFRQLLLYQRPHMNENDIPHQTKLTQSVLKKASNVQASLRNKLQDIPGCVSLTFDAWTSHSFDPYLGVSVHYIDVSPPTDGNPSAISHWSMASEIIAFTHMPCSHTGENISQYLLSTVKKSGIINKIGWMTSNNASPNDKAIAAFVKELPPGVNNRKPKASELQLHCMAHSINLAASHFLNSVHPTPSRFQTKKNQSSKNAKGKQKESDTAVDESAEDAEFGDYLEGDDVVDEEEYLFHDAGDLLGKLLALITQIRLSSQACSFLSEQCKATGCNDLELLCWIRTCWSSMYAMIEHALTLRKAIDNFVCLVDRSPNVPKLTHNRKYSDFAIEDYEWPELQLIANEIDGAQQLFSSETEPTAWKTISTLKCLLSAWEAMSQDATYFSLTPSIEKGIKNLTKWYKKLDNTSVYVIAQLLDPHVKLEYIKQQWDDPFLTNAMAIVRSIFDDYSKDKATTEKAAPPVPPNVAPKPAAKKAYGTSFIRNVIDASLINGTTADPRKELVQYLAEGLQPYETDILVWWSINSPHLPVLSRMALDYLLIQGLSVKCEQAFSSGGLTGTDRHNRLSPETFEALQTLKSMYKSGLISAAADAKGRVSKWSEIDNGTSEGPQTVDQADEVL